MKRIRVTLSLIISTFVMILVPFGAFASEYEEEGQVVEINSNSYKINALYVKFDETTEFLYENGIPADKDLITIGTYLRAKGELKLDTLNADEIYILSEDNYLTMISGIINSANSSFISVASIMIDILPNTNFRWSSGSAATFEDISIGLSATVVAVNIPFQSLKAREIILLDTNKIPFTKEGTITDLELFGKLNGLFLDGKSYIINSNCVKEFTGGINAPDALFTIGMRAKVSGYIQANSTVVEKIELLYNAEKKFVEGFPSKTYHFYNYNNYEYSYYAMIFGNDSIAYHHNTNAYYENGQKIWGPNVTAFTYVKVNYVSYEGIDGGYLNFADTIVFKGEVGKPFFEKSAISFNDNVRTILIGNKYIYVPDTCKIQYENMMPARRQDLKPGTMVEITGITNNNDHYAKNILVLKEKPSSFTTRGFITKVETNRISLWNTQFETDSATLYFADNYDDFKRSDLKIDQSIFAKLRLRSDGIYVAEFVAVNNSSIMNMKNDFDEVDFKNVYKLRVNSTDYLVNEFTRIKKDDGTMAYPEDITVGTTVKIRGEFIYKDTYQNEYYYFAKSILIITKSNGFFNSGGRIVSIDDNQLQLNNNTYSLEEDFNLYDNDGLIIDKSVLVPGVWVDLEAYASNGKLIILKLYYRNPEYNTRLDLKGRFSNDGLSYYINNTWADYSNLKWVISKSGDTLSNSVMPTSAYVRLLGNHHADSKIYPTTAYLLEDSLFNSRIPDNKVLYVDTFNIIVGKNVYSTKFNTSCKTIDGKYIPWTSLSTSDYVSIISNNENGKRIVNELSILPLNNEVRETKSTKTNYIVYPNPSLGTFKILGDLQTIYKIEIYNNLGEIVFRNNAEPTFDIDFSNQSAGIYQVAITTEHGRTIIPIVIIK